MGKKIDDPEATKDMASEIKMDGRKTKNMTRMLKVISVRIAQTFAFNGRFSLMRHSHF